MRKLVILMLVLFACLSVNGSVKATNPEDFLGCLPNGTVVPSNYYLFNDDQVLNASHTNDDGSCGQIVCYLLFVLNQIIQQEWTAYELRKEK